MRVPGSGPSVAQCQLMLRDQSVVPELKEENGNEIELVMYTDIPPGRVRYLWWGTRINMRALRGYGVVRQSDRQQGSVRLGGTERCIWQAKGLKWRFFDHESEQAEFVNKLKAMSWSFDFHLSPIP